MKRIAFLVTLLAALKAPAQKIVQVTKAKSINPVELIEFNGKIYFTGQDTSSKSQLFVLDKSKQGASPVTSFKRPTGLDKIFILNDKLYFQSPIERNNIDSPFIVDVFVTDGTPEGTHQVSNFPFDSQSSYYSSNYNKKLYYIYRTQNATPQIWVTDGTKNGTKLLYNQLFQTQRPAMFQIFSNKLYFHASNSKAMRGSQLWSIGEDERPSLLKDLSPNTNSGVVGGFKIYDGSLCFVFEDEKGNYKLGISDGTTDGTYPIQNFDDPNYSVINQLFEYNNNLYFFSFRDSSILYKYDGIGLTKVISFPSLNYYVNGLGGIWNGKYILTLHTPEHGSGLWTFDGTTLTPIDFAGDKSNDFAGNYYIAGKKGIYIFGNRTIKNTSGQGSGPNYLDFGLYYTDGTSKNTRIVIAGRNKNIEEIRERFFKLNEKLYFIAKTKDLGWQLFRIDE